MNERMIDCTNICVCNQWAHFILKRILFSVLFSCFVTVVCDIGYKRKQYYIDTHKKTVARDCENVDMWMIVFASVVVSVFFVCAWRYICTLLFFVSFIFICFQSSNASLATLYVWGTHRFQFVVANYYWTTIAHNAECSFQWGLWCRPLTGVIPIFHGCDRVCSWTRICRQGWVAAFYYFVFVRWAYYYAQWIWAFNRWGVWWRLSFVQRKTTEKKRKTFVPFGVSSPIWDELFAHFLRNNFSVIQCLLDLDLNQ